MDNPLLAPNPGLMIWTLITFLIVMVVLKKKAFGPMQQFLDQRRDAIASAVDEAQSARDEAKALLEQYNAKLDEARTEADAIVGRARQAGDELAAKLKADAEAQRLEAIEQTQTQVKFEVEKSMADLRSAVAEMTVEATGKVVRGALDASAQQALVEQAIDELDFNELAHAGAH